MEWHDMPRCEACMYWLAFGDETGTCHRYPPRQIDEARLSARNWPRTGKDDRCGEHSALHPAPRAPGKEGT